MKHLSVTIKDDVVIDIEYTGEDLSYYEKITKEALIKTVHSYVDGEHVSPWVDAEAEEVNSIIYLIRYSGELLEVTNLDDLTFYLRNKDNCLGEIYAVNIDGYL